MNSSQASRLDAATQHLAVGPVQRRGLLRATGKDARDYLHRMSTQAVNPLPAGRTAYACFLNAKGHLLGEGHLLAQEDGVLIDLDPLAVPEAKGLLEKFVIMDEVVFEDLSETHRVVPVLGPRAADAAEAAGREQAAPRLVNGRRGVPAVDLVVPAAEAEAIRARLLASGAVALEEADLEALRIRAGFARFGLDMDASRLPMEAGLATVRGHLQKGLVQLSLPAGAGPGAKLLAGTSEVGVITSAAETPDGRLGLGYLRRAHWKAGERLAVDGGEAVVRRVLAEEEPRPASGP
jgi:folate-binding Fe-S cluster repair protein YgfZ